MKLSQKQIELMANEIAIEATHFEIFDKSVFMKNVGLTFNQRLKMFYSVYHRCDSYKKG